MLCIVDKNPSVPIMALVDGDPYGLDIMSVYKNGSRSLTHENSSLAAPRVQWLGVRASELSGCAAKSSGEIFLKLITSTRLIKIRS